MKLAFAIFLLCTAVLVAESAEGHCDCYKKCGRTRKQGWCRGEGPQRFYWVSTGSFSGDCDTQCENQNPNWQCAIFTVADLDEVASVAPTTGGPYMTGVQCIGSSCLPLKSEMDANPNWLFALSGTEACTSITPSSGLNIFFARISCNGGSNGSTGVICMAKP